MFQIWITQCRAKTRQCDVGPGQNENIHCLAHETGAGDEIGWDFVDHVINSYITFCSLMNNIIGIAVSIPNQLLSCQTIPLLPGGSLRLVN